jgi:hypothetical protein
MKKGLLFVTLFSIAFLERTLFDLGPNFELITTAMILSAYYFGRKESFWITFAIIAFTDRIIGNSPIFLFTWTGFLLPSLFISNLFQLVKPNTNHLVQRTISPWLKKPITKKIFGGSSLISIGLVSNIFFYLWTNFGVWFLDTWNMYPNNFGGLIQSYVNALPFLKYNLLSTVILLPSTYFAIEAVKILLSRFESSYSRTILKKNISR